MEDRRSNHPDFATSYELKGLRWSGVRLNSITGNYEFWIDGKVAKEVSGFLASEDKFLLDRTHMELFGFKMKHQ